MFDTNDVFNDAVRGSTIYSEDENHTMPSSIGSKVVTMLVLTGVTYIGLNFYNSSNTMNEMLVVKNELVAEIQIESELQVTPKVSNSEAEYLSALREIESELTEERKVISLDTTEQMRLSSAMTDIMEDELLSENTKYTDALRKEIGVEVNTIEKSFSSVMNDFDDVMLTTNLKDDKEISLSLAMSELMDDTETTVEVSKDTRIVVVKKGDTLRGISNKFYGDAMNYKRIIASNDSLRSNDTIYEGQTILLPY